MTEMSSCAMSPDAVIALVVATSHRSPCLSARRKSARVASGSNAAGAEGRARHADARAGLRQRRVQHGCRHLARRPRRGPDEEASDDHEEREPREPPHLRQEGGHEERRDADRDEHQHRRLRPRVEARARGS